MPRTCSVPGCKSGYRGPDIGIQTFTFPDNEELRRKWIRAIHRSDDFVVTESSSVCIKHFHEEHINRYSTDKRKKEAVLLKRPHLRDNAVPGIFPNQPRYLSTEAPTNRNDPEKRRQTLIEKDILAFEEWQAKDKIKSFQDLLENYDSKCLYGFKSEAHSEFLYLYKINVTVNNIPQISCGLKVFTNLRIQAFVGNHPLRLAKFKGYLNKDLECSYWSAFESLLTHLGSLTTADVATFEEDIEALCGSVDIILDRWMPTLTNHQTDENSAKLTKLEFCREQIKLLARSVPKYTSSLLMWACSIFLAFPSGYVMMRNTKVLTLPHPTHLQRLSGDVKCTAGISKEQVTYLTTKLKNMQDYEKIVNVMLDEIYTVPVVESKGGKVVGLAADNGGATKVQGFMLSSLFGKKEDVIALFPVNSTDAGKLKQMTLRVLQVLTHIGYTVLSLSCDNNKMNRSMYQMLCGGGEIKQCFPNPYNKEALIFLLFDTVHLAKCVRNNWLNQKNALQTFFFPLMSNPSIIMSASVHDLKNLYFKEKDEILKLAPALSQKVLFPSSLERQNVNIALRLFDEKNIVALEKFAENGVSGTAEFIKIFLPWWCIVNVRAPNTGKHKRDPYKDPIRSPEDKNLKYLANFADFLKKWRTCKIPSSINVDTNTGRLTHDTHFALLHTTETLQTVCKYVFKKFTPHYILLGKFQTDAIESRFGKYRQMSGCNYHISVAQILESERKLKVMSLLKLRSEKYGDFELTDFSVADEMPEEIYTDVPNDEAFDVCLDKSDEVEVSESQGAILYFLGGYCSHLLLKHVGNCLDCKKVVVSDGEFHVNVSGITKETKEYLSNLSRGGLKQPTPILHEVVCIAYQIFAILISKDFEDQFLKVPSQRGLFKRLILKKLQFIVDLDEKCEAEKCGRSTENMLNKVAHTLANIFLNNYVKKKNDGVRRTKKRKLDTFDDSTNGPSAKKKKSSDEKEKNQAKKDESKEGQDQKKKGRKGDQDLKKKGSKGCHGQKKKEKEIAENPEEKKRENQDQKNEESQGGQEEKKTTNQCVQEQ